MSDDSLRMYLTEELRTLGILHEINWILQELDNLPIAEAKLKAQDFVSRRKQGEPLAYILGHWDFRKLKFSVGPGVLIPRPETEELVDHALAHIEKYQQKEQVFRVADLGSGSGAIAYSIALETKKEVEVIAIEKSTDAFEYLQKNLNLLPSEKRKNIKLFCGDWGDASLDKVNLIVSNPPYISAEEYRSLDNSVKSFEPLAALVPEGDSTHEAFAAYESILRLAERALVPGGALLLEFGPAQEPLWVTKIANNFKWKIFKDLSGKPRILYAFDFSPKTR